ncbi:AfsA-related hotdog domain-containing protein [Streptomyces sp. FXJ1.172]|uniref:AfsA-related hotdog domain-containing protein n=1 Tax=Streptomyces sp. FXJ1.172 TaxID=710705 RepID=UPI0007CFC2BC|nr:AfsA-related hotdog domain-containing protein [Streptomyces sp. FXJ1.172]WEO99082.1 AfsA-related hotdog domain-containing protein [Streptomyces sp. FXJ1.172]
MTSTLPSANTPATLPPPGVRLDFEQTVPRSLAHRSQIGEVFVADSAQSSDDDFHLSFQVPRAHSLWSDRDPAHHDPFASAEAARQSIFVLLHRYVGVPVGAPFSLQRIALRVEDPQAYANDGTTPLQGHLHFRVAERQGRGSDVVSMVLSGVMEIAGRRAMTLSAVLAFMSQEDYDVFRAFQRAQKPVATAELTPARPLAPVLVGRELRRNVVIGSPGPDSTGPDDGTARYLLAADRSHPAFFDHEYDHVPGPLMVEGLRQAAVAAACRSGALASPHALPVGCEASFLDFAEFEADLTYEAEVHPPGTDGRLPVTVRLRQFGATVVEGRIELLPDTGALSRPTAQGHGV